ncbi:hypothetical protein AU210_016346 [Fusarium oxysporum f. sp. radicis-cucumerinum]|uniref:Uncharacterized protein n=1 Tax=Fusarium oxysporum f. sp. radicis-cucumerinum TaxID=327505 RepID=A0A2H3FP08_FUSOX|nr:hypothetical protein AU210_016346 [Fusarium oxysporum f. sp. radicis-cucumerinum]
MAAPTAPAPPNLEDPSKLDEKDQGLLDHFIQHVLPTISPIIELDQHCSLRSDSILAALRSNSAYLHCCLGVAAQHLKSHTETNTSTTGIDNDIKRHHSATIRTIIEALGKGKNQHILQAILEAILGLIVCQSTAGPYDDVCGIPWPRYFELTVSLVHQLGLTDIVSDPARASTQTRFKMSLCSWIDILGATMKGRSPAFAHMYRKKNEVLINPSLSPSLNPSLGLRELMGCDDGVMYLISEVACLESLKNDGMDNFTLCRHVSALDRLFLAKMKKMRDASLKMPVNVNGGLSPKQLSDIITMAFCIAARIFLHGLVPGFNSIQPLCMELVEELTAVLQHIPSGPNGFDRNFAWVYLIGGSVSLPDSAFRAVFEDRLAQIGDSFRSGTMGRVATVLHEVWALSDSPTGVSVHGSTTSEGGQLYIHWRAVMQSNRWYLLFI